MRYRPILTLLAAVLAASSPQIAGAQAIKSIQLKLADDSLLSGENTLATATVLRANGKPATVPISWGTLNGLIATVDKNGIVTAHGAGRTKIRVNAGSIYGYADIVVYLPSIPNPVPANISVTLGKSALLIDSATQATAKVLWPDGTAPSSPSAVTWSSSNAAVASVSASGAVKALSAGSAAIRATRDGISGSASIVVSAPVVVTPPPNVPPSNNVGLDSATLAKVLALAGPLGEQLTPAWLRDLRKAYADTQWTQYGAAWNAGNTISVYNRPALFYMLWLATGDTVWKARAHALVTDYIAGYMQNGTQTPSPHFAQSESLALDCLIAKNPSACNAVFLPASNYRGSFVDLTVQPSYIANLNHPDVDQRIQARTIEIFRAAEAIDPANKEWATYLDSAVSYTLSSFNAQGWAPFVGACRMSLNYMTGLDADQLTRIHDQRPRAFYNARIEASMLALGTYLWTTQWRPQDLSFNYLSGYCEGTGSATSAPDLNGLMLPLFGWLGKQTRDPVWFARGDSIALGIKYASVYLYRQFSETFGSSFRYYGYRAQYLASPNARAIAPAPTRVPAPPSAPKSMQRGTRRMPAKPARISR